MGLVRRLEKEDLVKPISNAIAYCIVIGFIFYILFNRRIEKIFIYIVILFAISLLVVFVVRSMYMKNDLIIRAEEIELLVGDKPIRADDLDFENEAISLYIEGLSENGKAYKIAEIREIIEKRYREPSLVFVRKKDTRSGIKKSTHKLNWDQVENLGAEDKYYKLLDQYKEEIENLL